MTNPGKIRYAHQLINDMADGYIPDHEALEALRSVIPEPPGQKTLEELHHEVYDAWAGADRNDWPDDVHGELETWLWELHKQLEGLASTVSKPSQASPKLPEGMRLATHPAYGLCVVAPTTDEDGERRIFYPCDSTETGADCRWVPVVHLSFLEEENG